MNYHINREGEVRVCETTPERCPVLGPDGEKSPHFTDKSTATQEKERILNSLFKMKPLRKKGRGSLTEGQTKMLETIQSSIFRIDEEEVIIRDWAEDGAPEIASLREMRRGENSIDLCDFIAFAVSEEIKDEVKSRGYRLEPIAVGFSGESTTQHTALKISDGEDSIILDYAARQFNDDSEFPLLTTPEEWERVINDGAMEKYEIEIIGYYEDGYSANPLILL